MNVREVARLARIRLTDGEVEVYQEQMEGILHYVEQLNRIDVEGVEPTAHAEEIQDVYREDRALDEHRLSREDALGNAPETAHDQIRMPKVVE